MTTSTAPKVLYLMRHARAQPIGRTRTDHERALDDKGQLQALEMGRWLATEKPLPQVIWASDALRTRTTAEMVASQVAELKKQPREVNLLYSLYNCSLERFVHVLHTLPTGASVAMVVGHNATISDVASLLTGHAFDLEVGQVVAVELHVPDWNMLGAETCSLLWEKVPALPAQ